MDKPKSRFKINRQFLWLALCLFFGCRSTFMEVGVGYSHFKMEEVRSTTYINSTPVQTKLDHVNAFMSKLRGGGTFIEALPQLRVGAELRGAIGGTSDREGFDYRKAYSEIIMVCIGGGPFLAWKQMLGETAFLEAGTFVTGYTVGVHEKGYSRFGLYWEDESEGITGWSGGVYAKLGIHSITDPPVSFACECSYERGQWRFDGDIGTKDIEGCSILLSSELGF